MSHYEPGPYVVKITAQKFGTTPKRGEVGGTDYFALSFIPIEAKGANTLPSQEFERDLRLYLSEAAFPYSLAHLRDLGWTGTSFEGLNPLNAGHVSFVGQELTLLCDINERGYEDWNLAAPGKAAATASDSNVPTKLDRMYGKQLKSSAPAPAKKTINQELAELPDEVDEDSIPF